jgi:TonB family protein
MNRLQKKCVIASAGFHSLLVVILFIGPGFLSSKTAAPDLPILDFVPLKTVDALVSGGGERTAKPPPAPVETRPEPPQPPAPQPPPPEPKPDPEPPKELAKDPTPVKPETDSLVPTDKPKPRRPEISTTLVTRKPDADADKRAKAAAQAKAEAAERQRLAKAIGNAVEDIANGVSEGTSIQLKGPGGGGIPYANFLQAVKSAYMRALVTPDNLKDETATTIASVTIARDGSVISARIIHLSGDDQLDQAVQRTLDRVKYAAPLPDDATESKRTVEINFNARAKRGFG